MTAVLRTRPAARCPCCDTELDGGPVIWWCPDGHGQVHGSVLDVTVRAA
jgi:hypothetical protein